MLTAAGTWLSAGTKPWHISTSTRYEIHSKQKGRDIRPGDTFTIEWGVGKKITRKLELGVIGFFWRQATDITGSDSKLELKYKADGIGVEVIYPFGKILFRARTVFDVKVNITSEGTALIVEFTVPF